MINSCTQICTQLHNMPVFVAGVAVYCIHSATSYEILSLFNDGL